MDRCPKCGCVTCGSSWTMIKSTGRIGILKESELCLRRQLAAANERAGRLEKALNKLTTVVNGVTAPHRHGAPISNKHLDRLCEVQLECERILGGA